MLLDRGGDARLLGLVCGVIAAHQSLQLGKFPDHFGDEIGLGETRGARRLVRIGADERRQLARQRLDAFDALALRAELFMKDDFVEFR